MADEDYDRCHFSVSCETHDLGVLHCLRSLSQHAEGSNCEKPGPDLGEYWQIGIDLPRHDGLVWLPGDSVDDVDRFWDDRAPTPEEQEAIDEVREVRRLADRLRTQLGVR